MRLLVDHETAYSYDAPVRFSTQYLRLTPRDTPRQRVIEWKLETPGEALRTSDGYGNVLHVLTLDKPFTQMRIRALGAVETSGALDEPGDFTGTTLSPLLFLRFTPLTRPDAAIAGFAEAYRRRAGTLTGLRALAAAILARMPFTPGDTHVSSSAAEAFSIGSGVCQDHAHVFIACCRHLGVPARYVSGYIHSPGHADTHVSSHAWSEAWVMDRWRSFDVANDAPIGELHLKLAIGADYMDAGPIRGVRVGGGSETMSAAAYVELHSPQRQ